MERGANMIRQIPMLFSPAMVKALLAGRKTETRRIAQPERRTRWLRRQMPNPKFEGWLTNAPHKHDAETVLVGPKPGDLIWVKENYRIGAWRTEQWARRNGECDGDVAVDYMANGYARKEWLNSGNPEMMLRLINQSRDDAQKGGRFKPDAEFQYCWSPGESPCRIRPSIHMPKAFSRLTLRVTGFSIERLQDINEAGATAEGSEPAEYASRTPYRCGYADLWQEIHGHGTWKRNPFVGVTKFDVLHLKADA
jgi:hypothetical protein